MRPRNYPVQKKVKTSRDELQTSLPMKCHSFYPKWKHDQQVWKKKTLESFTPLMASRL